MDGVLCLLFINLLWLAILGQSEADISNYPNNRISYLQHNHATAQSKATLLVAEIQLFSTVV